METPLTATGGFVVRSPTLELHLRESERPARSGG